MITISAWNKSEYRPVAELLLVMGSAVLGLRWKLSIDEIAPHPAATNIELIPSTHLINTLQLMHMITPDVQIIDGKLEGIDESGNTRVTITAVDSTWWDVEAEDRLVNERIAEFYRANG